MSNKLKKNNFPYVLWIYAQNTTTLILFLALDHMESYQTQNLIINAINYNQLAFFLIVFNNNPLIYCLI